MVTETMNMIKMGTIIIETENIKAEYRIPVSRIEEIMKNIIEGL